MIKKIKQLSLAGCSFVMPALSHAQSIESILNRTTNYLQGGVAKSVGVLAIIVVGYFCIFKQVFPKEMFMLVLVGMGIIFGASYLYSTVIG